MTSEAIVQTLDKALKNAALILQHGGDSTRFRVGVCIVNLTNADEIQRTSGEQTANLLFQEFFDQAAKIARTRDEVIKLSDTSLAVIFKGEISQQELSRAGDRIGTLFDEPITIMAEQIKAVIGTGLAIAEDPSVGAQTLFETAVKQLEVAEEPENSDATDVDWAIKTNLEEAVNTGEFVVYYQPRIAPAFDHVIGATAHLRWHSSQKRVLEPHEFLETAAQTDLLEPIIHGMIKTSMSQVSRWPGELNLALAIPLVLFSDDTLIVLLRDLFAIFGIPPERIVLVLGDNELNPDDYQLTAAEEILAELRQMGLKISGLVNPHSPPKGITLDEYQVNAEQLKKTDPILPNLVASAKTNGAKLLVNNVNKQRDVDYFRVMGVDALQGDYYSPAIVQADFRNWLARKAGT